MSSEAKAHRKAAENAEGARSGNVLGESPASWAAACKRTRPSEGRDSHAMHSPSECACGRGASSSTEENRKRSGGSSLRFLCVLCVFAVNVLSGQDARQIVEEAQRRSHSKSERYEGTLQVINSKGKVSEKRWAYQRIGSHGNSKAILRFTAPAEVKGVALLVINHPDRASDQWMWRPAIARDQRIALQDRSTRFFGTDFSFEDLEERDVNQFDYRLLGEEAIDGAPCWKLEARPKQTKASQYTNSVLWIRKDNYALAQIENFNKEKLVRRGKYRDIQNVQGIWTARNIEMSDLPRNSRTILKLEKLQYNVPVREDEFTLQALRRES